MMKCLITDAVYEGIAEELKKYLDVTVTDGKPLSHEEMLKQIGDYDILIMRVNPIIDREILDAAASLKMIGVCAAGMNHIDMEYAKVKGIHVVNAAGLNANAVAELTFGMMLSLARKIIPSNIDVKEGHHWDRSKFVGYELRGKTLGIMGFGRVGRRVAELGKSFGMMIAAYDPYLKPEQFEAAGAKGMSVDELLKVSDFVSIHVPLTPETKYLFNSQTFSLMKDSAVILNMSRGGIVNEADMYEALKEGRIGGYATDVLENELAGSGLKGNDSFVSPLFECEKFLVTPHIGAHTLDTFHDIGIFITEKVKEFIKL